MQKKQRNVVILNPFKAGSSTFEAILNKFSHVKSKKFHSYGDKDKLVMPLNRVTDVVMIYRDPLDLYMSAQFEDISKHEYPYYYGTKEEVLAASTENLITHFEKYPWSSYKWLNYQYYIDTIHTNFNINKQDIVNFIKSDHKYKILSGNYGKNKINCLLLKTKHLNDSLHMVNYTFNIDLKNMERYRNGELNWYGEVYKKFKQAYLAKLDKKVLSIDNFSEIQHPLESKKPPSLQPLKATDNEATEETTSAATEETFELSA